MNLNDPLRKLKPSFLTRLRAPLFVTHRDILFTLAPFALWITLVYLRPLFVSIHCPSALANTPQACSPSSLPAVDQIAAAMESPVADGYSYDTQNLSGTLAIAVPVLYQATLITLGSVSPPIALTQLGTVLTLTFQAIAWNGAIGEATRILTHRTRPFVYAHQQDLGDNPAHYTSFYSGHTSFSAASLTALVLGLLVLGAPAYLILVSALVSQTLIFLTGIFRVLAGRHFITDTIAAAIAGFVIALFIFDRHRKNR